MSSPLVTMSPLHLPSAGPQPSPLCSLQLRWEASAAVRRDERDRPLRHEADANDRRRNTEGSEAPPPAVGLAVPVLTRSGALAWAAGRARMSAAAGEMAGLRAPHQAATGIAATAARAAGVGLRGGALLNVEVMASVDVQAAAADARAVQVAMADASSSAGHASVSNTMASAMMGLPAAPAGATLTMGALEIGGAPPAGAHGLPVGAAGSAAPEPGRRDPAGAWTSAVLPQASAPTKAPAPTAAPRQAQQARVTAAQAAVAASPPATTTTLSVPMHRLGEGQHVLASWPHGIQGSHVQLRSSSALGHRVLSEALEATSGTEAGPWIVEASGRSDDDGPRRDRSPALPWEDD